MRDERREQRVLVGAGRHVDVRVGRRHQRTRHVRDASTFFRDPLGAMITRRLPSANGRNQHEVRGAVGWGGLVDVAFRLVECLGECVPSERRALDAHRELHHSRQRRQLAEAP